MSAAGPPEVERALLAPDGPVAAAWWWLRELVEGDLATAWRSTAPEVRDRVGAHALRRGLALPAGGWPALGAARAPSPVGLDLEVVTVHERGSLERLGLSTAGWPLVADVPEPPRGPVPWLRLLMRRDGTTWTVAGLDGGPVRRAAAPGRPDQAS